jgi:hypothetical protein
LGPSHVSHNIQTRHPRCKPGLYRNPGFLGYPNRPLHNAPDPIHRIPKTKTIKKKRKTKIFNQRNPPQGAGMPTLSLPPHRTSSALAAGWCTYPPRRSCPEPSAFYSNNRASCSINVLLLKLCAAVACVHPRGRLASPPAPPVALHTVVHYPFLDPHKMPGKAVPPLFT